MRDLDWFLESNGTRSGPYSARQIVELYKQGKVAGHIRALSSRLGKDSIPVTELIHAFEQLNSSSSSSARSPLDDHFAAPPRPSEQLEKSTFITINPNPENQTDPTDTLFSAIQTVKDKKTERTKTIALQTSQSSAHPTAFENTAAKGGGSSKSLAWIVVFLVLATVGFGIFQWTSKSSNSGTSKTESAPAAAAAPSAFSRPDARPSAGGGQGALLQGSAAGSRPVNTEPPIQNSRLNDGNSGGGAMRSQDRNDEPPRVESEPRRAVEEPAYGNDSGQGGEDDSLDYEEDLSQGMGGDPAIEVDPGDPDYIPPAAQKRKNTRPKRPQTDQQGY